MDADLKKLRKIVKIMRSEGVLHLEMSGIKLSVAPGALEFKDETKSPPTVSSTDSQIEAALPSPEEMLFWSAPGFFPAEPNQ